MRDRTLKPITPSQRFKITQDEIDSIRASAKDSQKLLENTYLTTYFANAKQSILDIHAAQLIETATITKENNGMKESIIKHSKKEYTMLAGQYRFIDKFIQDLQSNITLCQEMEEKIKSGELEVQESESE